MSSLLNVETARELMIQQQIRPWLVLHEATLTLLKQTPRENFVPKNLQNMAFTDTEIPLTSLENKGDVPLKMFTPKFEGRLIQELMLLGELTYLKTLKVLQIGLGSGYLTALLAKMYQHVTAYETHHELATSAKQKLQMFENISIIQENGDQANPLDFDIVVYDGAVYELTEKMQGKVATIAIVGERFQDMKLVLVHQHVTKIIVEASAEYLSGFEPKKQFHL